jgi:fibronectin type 3 domain-containing protein
MTIVKNLKHSKVRNMIIWCFDVERFVYTLCSNGVDAVTSDLSELISHSRISLNLSFDRRMCKTVS